MDFKVNTARVSIRCAVPWLQVLTFEKVQPRLSMVLHDFRSLVMTQKIVKRKRSRFQIPDKEHIWKHHWFLKVEEKRERGVSFQWFSEALWKMDIKFVLDLKFHLINDQNWQNQSLWPSLVTIYHNARRVSSVSIDDVGCCALNCRFERFKDSVRARYRTSDEWRWMTNRWQRWLEWFWWWCCQRRRQW